MAGDIRGDVGPKLRAAVRGVDVIFHLAAAVGVGQSMYEIAAIWSPIRRARRTCCRRCWTRGRTREKMVVASSMSIYGEGKYFAGSAASMAPPPRGAAQLKRKHGKRSVRSVARADARAFATKTKPLQCTSIYALSKKDQEEMTLLFGRTYGIAAVALRYFNIYGTRQALSNPYTGVAAILRRAAAERACAAGV